MFDLKQFKGTILRNLGAKELMRKVLSDEVSYLTKRGAVGMFTGERTSRSPDDRFIVRDKITENKIDWGKYNNPMEAKTFDLLLKDVVAQMKNMRLYMTDFYAGMNEEDSIKARVITPKASQALYCEHMFKNVRRRDFEEFEPEYTIIASPDIKVDPKKYNINSDVVIALNWTKKIFVVVGTGYSCEIKKALFSTFNFWQPQKGVLSMHCSCNSLPKGKNSALFFGLSGTGKTTLSNTKGRNVVGDDQHCWSDEGVSNIENGCYAKVYGLSKKSEPEIYHAIRDGAMLENVLFKNGEPDFNDARITENMRVAYPMWNLKNVELSGTAEHPKNIFFLTADSSGVFPPISKLNVEQAKFYFVNGFTSKMGGTENKIAKPEFTFSSCFGAPFMPLKPQDYAELFGKRVEKFDCNVWLVNTGWTGGSYGQGGTRMKLKETRKLVSTAIKTGFKREGFEQDSSFGLLIPKKCGGVDSQVLNPINAWTDKKEFAETVKQVKSAFSKNCKKLGIENVNK